MSFYNRELVKHFGVVCTVIVVNSKMFDVHNIIKARTPSGAITSTMPTYVILPTYFILNHNGLMHKA